MLNRNDTTFLHQVNPSVTNNCSSDRLNLNECSHNILTAFFKENDWQLYEYHLFNDACLQYFYSWWYVPTTVTNFDVITGHYHHSHRMKNSLWHKNCFRLRPEWQDLIKPIHKTSCMQSAMRDKKPDTNSRRQFYYSHYAMHDGVWYHHHHHHP